MVDKKMESANKTEEEHPFEDSLTGLLCFVEKLFYIAQHVQRA